MEQALHLLERLWALWVCHGNAVASSEHHVGHLQKALGAFPTQLLHPAEKPARILALNGGAGWNDDAG